MSRNREPLPTTLAEFVVWHQRQPECWEFIGGEPVMMTPGSRQHTMIKGNIYAALRRKLVGTGCTAYVDGIELRAFEQSAIPDVVVSCAPPDFSTPVEEQPVVIVEVSSPSSYGRDMGLKLERYRFYPSLRYYLVVHHTQHAVIVFDRESADRQTTIRQNTDVIELAGIGVGLSLHEIFENVPPPAARGWKKTDG